MAETAQYWNHDVHYQSLILERAKPF